MNPTKQQPVRDWGIGDALVPLWLIAANVESNLYVKLICQAIAFTISLTVVLRWTIRGIQKRKQSQ